MQHDKAESAATCSGRKGKDSVGQKFRVDRSGDSQKRQGGGDTK